MGNIFLKMDLCCAMTLSRPKGITKDLCNKDVAELSDDFSGLMCLKSLVLQSTALKWFRTFFGNVPVNLCLSKSFRPLILGVVPANQTQRKVDSRAGSQERAGSVLILDKTRTLTSQKPKLPRFVKLILRILLVVPKKPSKNHKKCPIFTNQLTNHS